MKILFILFILTLLIIGCSGSTTWEAKHVVVCQQKCLSEGLDYSSTGLSSEGLGSNILLSCYCEKLFVVIK